MTIEEAVRSALAQPGTWIRPVRAYPEWDEQWRGRAVEVTRAVNRLFVVPATRSGGCDAYAPRARELVVSWECVSPDAVMQEGSET